MTICFSGEHVDSEIAKNVYQFFETKCYPVIADYVVELYHCDLSDDNMKGYQEKNGDEFLLHIDTNLNEEEYIKTILHELVHCVQDIAGISNNEEREDQAYKLEGLFYPYYIQGGTPKLLYR